MIFFYIVGLLTMIYGGALMGITLTSPVAEGIFRAPFKEMLPALLGLILPGFGFFVAGCFLVVLATIAMRVGRPIRIVSRKEYDD
jgi:hypothetical protein